MPLPEDRKLKFFVFVIESPSAVDLYHRRSEGEIIRQAANLNLIPCHVLTAINPEAFEAALKIGLSEAMQQNPGLIPILHISAHGYQEGIQLSNGEIINWAKLRQYFIPLNQALNNNLLVCLSCCEGYSGIRMAMFLEDQTLPFFGIVANGEKPTWSETAVAFSTFYHQIARGEFVPKAVEAMQIASGNFAFWCQTGEETRQSYISYISQLNADQVQNQLEQNNRTELPGHLENLRKVGRGLAP